MATHPLSPIEEQVLRLAIRAREEMHRLADAQFSRDLQPVCDHHGWTRVNYADDPERPGHYIAEVPDA